MPGREKAMKLSTKGRYGLRAMIDLAQYSEQEAVSISSISQRQNISESYLEQLVAKLKKAGLVMSMRGAQEMCSARWKAISRRSPARRRQTKAVRERICA